MATLVLLDLMGGVALLLWGLHMVQSGVLRAFGADLQRLLAKALGNRFAAFAAGFGLTALLQSSTATGLMTASFAAEGMVALVPALVIMSLAYSNFVNPTAALALVLGANLGSAINPVFEGARRGDLASYRLPIGNLINRLVGVVLVLPLLGVITAAFKQFQPDMAR